MVSIKGINVDGEPFFIDTTSVRETKIITATHYMLVACDVRGDSLLFNRSYAGAIKINGNHYEELPIQASVQIFDNVKTDFTWNPDDVVARLFHAASLLREHRGDGHVAALMTEGIGGLESHVLFALDMGAPAEKFGRIHHLPAPQLAAVIDGMRDRGLIGNDGWLSESGRAVKHRVEAITDALAAKPYESLDPDELGELVAALEPLAARLLAAQDW